MCGIVGWIQGKKKIKQEELQLITKKLFMSAQSRGSDATGMGYIEDGKMTVIKDAVPASKFLPYVDMVPTDKVKIFIGHTRAATQGHPSNNMNNHPIVSKVSSIALVHNGYARTQVKLKKDAEVDSEDILRLVEQKDKVEDGITYAEKKYTGASAYAIIGTKFPDTIYLVRSGQPLWLGYVKELDLIVFASTQDIVSFGMSDYKLHHKIFLEKRKKYSVLWKELDDNGYIVIHRKKDGFSFHTESFKKETQGYFQTYYGNRGSLYEEAT